MKHFHTKSMILSAVILSALSIHTVGAATPETVNLDLGKTVRMALDNNSSVKISAAELEAAKANLDQAKGAGGGALTSAITAAGRRTIRVPGRSPFMGEETRWWGTIEPPMTTPIR